MPNPTVLVDLDDTLADTQVAMLRYINARGARQFTFAELTREHREQEVAGYDELVNEFLRQPELVRQTAPYDDAREAIRQLHAAGLAIHIVSARREILHGVTDEWLGEHGFARYVTEIHRRSSHTKGRDFKRLVSEKIHPIAAFDDTYDVAETLAATGVPVYLIDKPWNQEERLPAGITRVPSFAAGVHKFLAERGKGV